MTNLSDTINRKFDECIDVNEWEVYSHDGWKEVKKSNKTIKYEVVKITLDNGKELECADDHIIIDSFGEEIFAKDSLCHMVKTDDGDSLVISVEPLGIEENMYDLSVDGDNLYYTNGILSHNTTVAASYILHFATFHDSKQSAVLANQADQAQEILERIQLSYELLPVFLKRGVKVYNKRSMTFDNSSKIFSGASTKSAIRGKSIALTYWDEASWTENDQQFYDALLPTLSSGEKSKMIVTSTPNGARGVFHKIWSESPENGYATIKVTWDQIPSRDEEWKKRQIAASSYEQFLQEHCAEFRSSQNALIAGHALEGLIRKDPIEEKNNVRIYSHPKKDHIYAMTVDVARGIGGDYSAFLVIDVTESPYNVVAAYNNNKIDSMLFPSVIFSTATHYNDSMVLVELNDNGEQVANILFHEYDYDELLKVRVEKNRQVVWHGGKSRLGVRTSTAVKSVGCSNLKTLIESNQFNVYDKDTIGEFSTFVPKGKSYAAQSGAHDDLAMCGVLFGWLTTQEYFKEITNIDTRENILKQRDEEEMMPFGFIESGIDDEIDSVTGAIEATVDIDDPFFSGF